MKYEKDSIYADLALTFKKTKRLFPIDPRLSNQKLDIYELIVHRLPNHKTSKFKWSKIKT